MQTYIYTVRGSNREDSAYFGEKFLLYSPDPDSVIKSLIFSAPWNLENLFNGDVWVMDGTFRSSPRSYEQIYTIHSRKGNGQPGIVNTKIIVISLIKLNLINLILNIYHTNFL